MSVRGRHMGRRVFMPSCGRVGSGTAARLQRITARAGLVQHEGWDFLPRHTHLAPPKCCQSGRLECAPMAIPWRKEPV